MSGKKAGDNSRTSVQRPLIQLRRLLPQFLDRKRKPKAERVHELRVLIRRAREIVRMAAPACGRRKSRRLVGRLKGLMRHAGAARDADILRIRLLESQADSSVRSSARPGKKHWSAPIQRELERQRKSALRALSKGSRIRESRKLLRRIARRIGSIPRRQWVELSHAAIAESAAKACQLLGERGEAGAETMHRLRLALKSLRYRCEHGAALPPAAEPAHLLAELRRVQDILGDANDHANLARRIASIELTSKCRKLEATRKKSTHEQQMRRLHQQFESEHRARLAMAIHRLLRALFGDAFSSNGKVAESEECGRTNPDPIENVRPAV